MWTVSGLIGFEFVLLTGCVSYAIAKPAQVPPLVIHAKPIKLNPADDDLQKLLKAHYNERLAIAKAVLEQARKGILKGQHLVEPVRDLMRAALQAPGSVEEQTTLLKQILTTSETLEVNITLNGGSSLDIHRAHALVLEVQIEVLKLKKTSPKSNK